MCQEEAGAISTAIRCESSRRKLRDNRRKLRILLTDPIARRRFLLRRAYRNLSSWQRFMCDVGWAELLLENEGSDPEYKINLGAIIAWVSLLGFVVFFFIVKAFL